MLNSLLWNVALTAGLAIVLTAVCRLPAMNKRPALRQMLWLLLLAKLITPPLIAIPLLPAVERSDDAAAIATPPSESAVDQRTQASFTVDKGAGSDVDGATSRDLRSGMQVPYLGGLLVVSLIGTCVLLTAHGVRVVKLTRWLRRAGAENTVLAATCADVASSLDIRGVVQSRVVDARMTPLLWAWLQPLVVVPRQLVDDLDPQQLRSIVAHELAHFLRRDHWTNVFVFMVKVLLWWNPVVWWADREQRAAQELCCDAIAIDRCNSSRRGYATILLKALDFVQAEPLALSGLAPGMGSRASILRRFEMIGETQLSYRLSRWTPWVLLVVAIPLVCIPVRGQDEGTAADKKAETAEADPARTADLAETESTVSKVVERVTEAFTEKVVGERPRGNCSISGKVVSAETGQPVEHARMYLHYAETHGSIFVNTARDGIFVFKEIPRGPFSLMSSMTAGYQDASYDPEGKSGQFPQFMLEEDEHRSGIVLKVNRAYRISGKIVDENGKIPGSIATQNVLAWMEEDDSKAFKSKQARVRPADGSYVIDGLGGKPVYVMAINWRAAQQGNAYPPIYYPGTFSRSDAQLITFDKEKNIGDIDITLQKEGGLVIEGSVTDEAGKPVPEAFVVVHRHDMLFDFVTAYTDERGRYRIQGLGDGVFLVHVDAVHRGFVRTRTPIELDGQSKQTQQDFTLLRGVEISGRFVDEAGKEWQIGNSYGHAQFINDQAAPIISKQQESTASFSLTRFWNKYRPNDVTAGAPGSFSLGEGSYENGQMLFPTNSTFVIQGMMQGHTVIGFAPMKEGQEVLKILYDERDIMEAGIVTKPGQEIEDVRIVIGKP